MGFDRGKSAKALHKFRQSAAEMSVTAIKKLTAYTFSDPLSVMAPYKYHSFTLFPPTPPQPCRATPMICSNVICCYTVAVYDAG